MSEDSNLSGVGHRLNPLSNHWVLGKKYKVILGCDECKTGWSWGKCDK